MKTVCVSLLLAMTIIIAGCSSGESFARKSFDFSKVTKVAVVDVQGAVEGEAAKGQIADFMNMALLQKGYSPVERTQVDTLLKEQDFQISGLTSKEGVAQAGKILNVPAVIIVNVPKFDEEMSITAKMIDTEDGSILWVGTGFGRTGRTLGTIVGAVFGAGAGVAAGGENNKVAGGVAGGVLGGVAGNALSPQQAQEAQKVIKKISKTLPSPMPCDKK